MYTRALESFSDPLNVDNETLLVFERTLKSWTTPNVPNVNYRVPDVVSNVGRRAQRDIFVWCPTSSNMCPTSYATYIECPTWCPTLMVPNVVPNVREVFKKLCPTSFAPQLFK